LYVYKKLNQVKKNKNRRQINRQFPDDNRGGLITEVVFEKLVYSAFSHLTLLLAREYLIEFTRHESFKLDE